MRPRWAMMDPVSIIAWQDPPHTWRDDVASLAGELRAHPGEWALVQQGWVPQAAWVAELERHGIETRMVDRGRLVDLYARA